MITDFLLVIPAFEEGERLPGFLKPLAEQLDSCGFSSSILVVDDGSSADESAKLVSAVERIRREHERVLPPLVLPKNRGKGGAIKAGWSSGVNARWLSFVDADGSISPSEVIRLLTMALADFGERKSLFASRIRMLGRVVERNWLRHLSGRVYATLVGRFIYPGVYDSQCGFKVVPARAFASVRNLLREERFTFDVELMAALLHCGFPTEEVPIDWHDVPGSKVSFFRDTFLMAKSLLRIRARRAKWPEVVNESNDYQASDCCQTATAKG